MIEESQALTGCIDKRSVLRSNVSTLLKRHFDLYGPQTLQQLLGRRRSVAPQYEGFMKSDRYS